MCYEAGPTGYVLYWQLTQLGVACEVVAPTLVPVKPGDRVKTDRRDAEKLARSYRSGDLTAVWVPDAAHEALRDLVRAREAAKKDQLRARHRLDKFLLRHGRRRPAKTTAWGTKHRAWLKTVRFDHPAQEATLLDYGTEVEHARDRIARLERDLDTAIAAAPEAMRAVISAIQALRAAFSRWRGNLLLNVGRSPLYCRSPQPVTQLATSRSAPAQPRAPAAAAQAASAGRCRARTFLTFCLRSDPLNGLVMQ